MRGMVYLVSSGEGEKVDARGAQPWPSRSGASTLCPSAVYYCILHIT